VLLSYLAYSLTKKRLQFGNCSKRGVTAVECGIFDAVIGE
jgi:hypothetical protein